jgi:uncharacterized protein with HEPN domain
MSRDWRLYLDEIVEYSDRAQRHTVGLTYDEFLANELHYDATLRCLEVIGEAVKNLPEEVRQRAPTVPWAQIAGFRNRLAHGYFSLKNPLIWEIIQQHLPTLRAEADRLRNDPSLPTDP